MQRSQIARDISYSHSARTRGGRVVIRALENATGRISLIRRAEGYETDIAAGRCFWEVLTERFGVDLQVTSGMLSSIPEDGPVIVTANHPYGILDGLLLGQILSQRRGGDFRILANSVFAQAEALRRVVLPISFDETREATRLNLETRAQSLDYLRQGGAIGIFPGGTVSTAARPFARPMDPGWRTFTARLIAKSGATVIPVFFEGHNSRLFQLASHLHQTLRLGLLIKEFRSRVGGPVRVAIGEPIAPERLRALHGDSKAMMDFLRRATYDLSSKPVSSYDYGFEFDAKYKG